MTTVDPEISIVVPVYNEAPNLDMLYAELTQTMEAYGRSYEVVAVDDGSRDQSFEVLRGVHARDSRWRVVKLARNFGQNPAVYAGFEQVRGKVVVTIDADLQNPPSEIPKLVDGLESGAFDVVQGWRMNREDNAFRRAASRAINRLVSRITRVKINDLGSGMKAYRRDIVRQLCLSTHGSRYLPAETAWLGVKVGEVQVAHRSRAAGDSKYGVLALLRVNFDMVTSISSAPIHLIGAMGGIFALIGFAMALRVFYWRFVLGNYNEFAAIAAMFFVLSGVQMICTSIMCEYISRIYNEVQRRPYYIVEETLE